MADGASRAAVSLVAGLLFALWAKQPTLGDVPPAIIALGTLSSAVTGAIGGAVGYVIATRLLAAA